MASSGPRDAADADGGAGADAAHISTALPDSVDQAGDAGDAGVPAGADGATAEASLPNSVEEAVSPPSTPPPLIASDSAEKPLLRFSDTAAATTPESQHEISGPRSKKEVRWQFEDGADFTDYSEVESSRIEAAYQKGAWMIRTKTAEGKKAKPREIYFADMIQYDPGANTIRNVRRIPEMPRIAKFSRHVLAILTSFLNAEEHWWKPKTREMFEQQRFGEVQEKLAEEIAAETYRVDTLAYKISSSWWFNTLAMTMILINSIYIWIDADYNEGSTIMDTPVIFTLVDNVFLIWFIAEAIIRIRALQKWWSAMKDAWFALDLALVLLMLFETWILQLIVYLAVGSSDSQHLNKLSILRGLRLLRLARVARLFRVFPQLFVLIKGMVLAMKSLFYTLLLLFVLTFVCAVVFKNLSDMNADLAALQFDSVGGAFWNLLIYGIFLDSVGEMLTNLKDINVFFAFALLVFIFISNLTMLNMLIGILCEVIAKVAEEEEGNIDHFDLERSLMDILDCYDLDNDQSLRKEEFQILMENPDLKVILDKYSIDIQALTRLQDILFIRKDNEDGSMTFTELKFNTLIEKVHQLRGGNSATVNDMVELRNWLKRRFNLLEGLHPDTAMRSRPTAGEGKDAFAPKSPIAQHKMATSTAPNTIKEDGVSFAEFQQAILSQLEKMHQAQLKVDEDVQRLNEKVAALAR